MIRSVLMVLYWLSDCLPVLAKLRDILAKDTPTSVDTSRSQNSSVITNESATQEEKGR